MNCSSCGTPLEGGSFCPSCGARQPSPATQPPDAWQAVGQEVSSYTVTVNTACAHCAEPVPVNGATSSLHCAHCDQDMPLPAGLAEALNAGNQDVSILGDTGAAFRVDGSDEASPECPRCRKAVPVAAYLQRTGATTTLPCPSCGGSIPTYPAPAWLKEQLPTALQVFGGDAESAKAAGVDLHVDESAPKPLAMTCPSCGGGLTVTTDTARTAACKFCNASVFLPDELWRRLHPVRTMLRWTLTYTGELDTKADIEQRQEEERRNVERKRRREFQHQREAQKKSKAKQKQIEAKWKRRARVVDYVIWGLVIPAAIGGWLVGAGIHPDAAALQRMKAGAVLCLPFAAVMRWTVMRPGPIAQIDKDSSTGDVIALLVFELVGFLAVLGPIFAAALCIAGIVNARS